MMKIHIYVYEIGFGYHTLPAVPSKGDSIEFGGTTYMVHQVRRHVNQDNIDIWLIS